METNGNVELSSLDFKVLISTIDKPYILRNIPLKWNIFEMTLKEWCDQMDRESSPVTFTSGTNKHADLPYWESFRKREQMRFSEFLQLTNKTQSTDRWYSHSYRDISSWPEHLRQSISFEALGFNDTEDILFWLGSKGANTPCHYDTYGFNIVVQVFGRKSWVVFPPNTALTATRVPYEESSVYCKQNFYSPNDLIQFGGKKYQYSLVSNSNYNFFSIILMNFTAVGTNNDAYEIVLNPGDILIVPPKWWHYVENLETSLTVNTWIPLVKCSCCNRFFFTI